MVKRKHFLWPVLVCLFSAFWAIETPLALLYGDGVSPFFGFNLALSAFFLWELWGNRKKVEAEVLFLKQKRWHVDWWIIGGIMASLPYDLFYLVPALKGLAMLKVLRLVGLARTYKDMHTFTENPRFFRLMIIFSFALVSVHLVATTWTYLNPTPDLSPLKSYVKSFYWAVTTLTTTGYGDITPTTDLGRAFTSFIMLLGFSAFGIMVGNISNLIMAKNRHKEATQEKMEDLALFMQHYEIPKDLRGEVYNFHTHRSAKRLSEDDDKIIADLPQALRSELQVFMKIKLIDGLPVFHGLSRGCLKQVALAMVPQSYHAGQFIIQKGAAGEEMYIIDHGEVEVLNDDHQAIAILKHGQCFGEIALLMEVQRTASVMSKTYCDVYSLSKKDFVAINRRYPELEENFQKIMRRRSRDRAA